MDPQSFNENGERTRVAGGTPQSVVPGYRLLEALGQGGFARVFRAVHERTQRTVALKVLRLDATLDDARRSRQLARFWRETALCADLHHPHIVGLLDRGQTSGGDPFAAYEFVPGETLGELVRRGRGLPAAEAGELMGQVLDALACAHARGIIHRDLKPDNIMVTRTGSQAHVVVLDFGISALTEQARGEGYENLTLTREAVGTPAYAAPEQLLGAPPTPRSDIYAWALVFIECLTGEPAVRGHSVAEVLRRQLDANEIQLPAGLAATSLGALLRSALRKQPSERAGDAVQLHAELRRLNLAGLVGALRSNAPDSVALGTTLEAIDPVAELGLGAERRQVTALCSSVEVRSPAVSGIEQERLEAAQRRLLAEIRDALERFGGWVGGVLAGRMLVYFGYPHAADGGPARASRAALFACERARSELDAELDVRFVIHTGPVIIRQEGLSEGLTQGTALRLVASAAPGRVHVTASTAALLRDDPELAVLAPETPSGSEQLLAVETRVPAGGSERPELAERLVGRERELELVEDALRRDAETTFVVVSGEAGIGKSRLVEELAARERARGGDVLTCRCQPEQENAALFPLLERLRREWRLVPETSPERSALLLAERLVELGFESGTELGVLSAWLEVPLPAHVDPPLESPARQKALLFGVLERALSDLGQAKSGLLLVEDAHWADPTTREFLLHLAARRSARRRTLVVTTRDAAAAPPSGERGLALVLRRLSPSDTHALAAQLLGGPLSRSAGAELEERTGGVPLFLQQLVRMLDADGHFTRHNGELELAGPLGAHAVPGTLRDLLAARLDRLGPARDTATLAAALGRSFSQRLLALVSDKTPAELAPELRRLIDEALIVEEPARGDDGAGYAFRHALLRDVAYESLLPSARTRIHARIADVIEGALPELVRSAPALFARHLAAAERYGAAAEHGVRAAEIALGRAAHGEARTLAAEVVGWTRFVPEPERVDAELRANGVLTQALMALRGWADPEVKACVDASTRLLARRPDAELETRTRWALMTYHYVASHRQELARLTREFAERAEQAADDGLRIAARTFGGLVEHGAGNYAAAERELAASRGSYSLARHRDHGHLFGLDSWVWSTATLALVRWFAGDAESGRELAEAAVARARELGHVPSLGIALLYAANLHHYAGDKAEVERLARELFALDERYDFPAYRAYAAILSAWAGGDRDTGPAIVGQLRAMGCTAALSYYGSLAAESAAEQGAHAAAVATFSECLELCSAHDEHYYEAELRFRRGLSLQAAGNADAARLELASARQLARRQGAAWVERRADATLVELATTRTH